MAILRNLDAAVGANYISDATGGAAAITFSASTTDAVPLKVSRATIGIATGGLMAFATSGASIPVLQFGGSALASVSTIKWTTGGVAGTKVIRVTDDAGVGLGWIPVLPDGAITAVVY